MDFDGIYHSKRVLVTGHTGFKGAWLTLWLKSLGADVAGVALNPTYGGERLFATIQDSLKEDYREDIRDGIALKKIVKDFAPNFVFHLAAQPLVIDSYRDPVGTVETNVCGTANILEATRLGAPEAHTVIVTTDKCYENEEWFYSYRETDKLGGRDLYAASKAAAEIITSAFRRSFFERDGVPGRVATARGGNVIGGGDYAMDRILPDIVRALTKNDSVTVRNPHATRPWQHVLDCLSGYLTLGAWLASESLVGSAVDRSFNFGPSPDCERKVSDLVEKVLSEWSGRWETVCPSPGITEASRLRISIDLAVSVLGWRPVWNFDETVKRTIEWYKMDAGDFSINDLKQLMVEQIKSFSSSRDNSF